MTISILIPHFRSKIIAYAVYQILKLKGNHEVEILISDNNAGDGTIEYLKPFGDAVKIFEYPKNIISSHGVAFEYLLPHITNEYFITLESDSFPTENGFLDYYEKLINGGCEMAASLLKLSGGTFYHPTGALYKRTLWEKAKKYCMEIPYTYFPNMASKEGFDAHLMVRNDILEKFLSSPDDYVELSESYKKMDRAKMERMAEYYSPVAKGPFHQGMGGNQESVKTYGQRSIESDSPHIIMNNKSGLITRVGYEPGQWLGYFATATMRRIFTIPTKVEWMPGKENQQQAYTITENGIFHAWAGSAYLSMKDTAAHDVYEYKQKQIDDLYNSLPDEYKIEL